MNCCKPVSPLKGHSLLLAPKHNINYNYIQPKDSDVMLSKQNSETNRLNQTLSSKYPSQKVETKPLEIPKMEPESQTPKPRHKLKSKKSLTKKSQSRNRSNTTDKKLDKIVGKLKNSNKSRKLKKYMSSA